MIFTELITDLQNELKKELAQIRFLIKKNPGLGYNRIVEIGKEVGKMYNIKLIVNFPKEGRIEEFEMYGKRDLSLIIDYERKRFCRASVVSGFVRRCKNRRCIHV